MLPQAFRHAANAVQRSDKPLGDYFRRMKARGGNKYAIIATADKIAAIYYKMVRYKVEFNPVNLKGYNNTDGQKLLTWKESYHNCNVMSLKLYRRQVSLSVEK